MSAHASFDLERGLLRLARPTLAALRAHSSGGEPGAEEHLAALRRAGVLLDGRVHREVEAALAPMERPACELAVRADGRLSEGFMAPDAVTFVLSSGEELVDVNVLHPSLLPWMLARLVGLGPRARDGAAAGGLRLAREELERLLSGASEDPSGAAGAAGDGHAPAAGAPWDIAAGLRGRWRAEARWVAPGGRPGARAVEVLDTETGLWLAEPEANDVALSPITPTSAWRLLIRLPPSEDELDPAVLSFEPSTAG